MRFWSGWGSNEENAPEAAPGERSIESGLDAEGLADQCLVAGLIGHPPLENVRDSLKRERDRLVERRKTSHSGEMVEIQDRLEEATSRRTQLAQRLANLEAVLVERRDILAEVDRELAAQKHARTGLLRTLAKRRFSYPVRILEKRMAEQVELARQLAETVRAIERTVFDLDQEHHDLETQRRKLNAREYERRSKELLERRDLANKRLAALDARIADLQQVGVTRKTYGFLIWAGYLSFPAFGWFAGQAIQRAAGNEGSILRDLVQLLSEAVLRVQGSLGLAWTAALVIGLPLALLGLWLLLLVATDRLVSRFDRKWRSDRERGTSRAGAYLQPPAPIQRSDYTQLLARAPAFYLAWLVPMALAVLVALAQEGQLGTLAGLWARPGEAVFYTFLGATLAVGVSAFTMLYTTRVVEPRLRSGPTGARSALVANAELVLLAAAAVVAILGQAAARTEGPSWSLQSPPGILLLLLLGGFLVAYGLMYKGLFQTRAALTEEVRLLEEEISRYTSTPAVRVLDPEAAAYRERLRELYKESDARWRQVERYDRPALGIRSWWRRWSVEPGETLPPSYRSLDTLIEPQLVERIDDLGFQAAEREGRASALRGEIDALRQDLLLSRQEHDETRREVDQLAATKAELQERFTNDMLRLDQRYRDTILRAETAYRMGEEFSGVLDTLIDAA